MTSIVNQIYSICMKKIRSRALLMTSYYSMQFPKQKRSIPLGLRQLFTAEEKKEASAR